FPVMARILQEKGLTQSPMGAVGVAAAAVVTVLMFLAVAVAAGVASEQGPSSLATKFVVAGVYIAILFLVVKRLLAPLGRAYEARGTLTPTIFAVIMIVLFASAYTAHKIGINVIVGGFLAGSILPARQALFRDMAGRLADFTAIILLPIFLAFSGLNTDFTTLGVSFMGGIAIFLLAGIVGKWLGGAVFARLGGLSWAEGNVLGILMNCRGLLVLVVGLIGFSQGVISGPMQVGGVVMALVTTMMTGPLFDAFMPRVRGAAPAGTGPATSPDATGALRVLAVLDDPDRAPAVAHAAFTVVGGQRPAEVVLCRLFPLPLHGGILSGINDEALEAERSLRALRIVGSLGPPGVVVSLLARSSVDEAADYAHLAEERGCDLAVVDGEARLGGGPAERELSRLLTLTAADVVVYHHGTDGTPALATDAPVTVFAGEADPVALRLGEQVAASLGRPLVPALADPDDVALAEAGRRSAALVVAGRPDLLRGAVVAACPLYVVHARRPAVAAAPAQG
ncbi:MAG: cation:proton antiporter, partial [Acidimicrobiales bacterium]